MITRWKAVHKALWADKEDRWFLIGLYCLIVAAVPMALAVLMTSVPMEQKATAMAGIAGVFVAVAVLFLGRDGIRRSKK